MSDPDPAICHRCGRLCAAGDAEFWVVRIEAFADPTVVLPDPEEFGPPDIEGLIERAREYSEQELMDQVHRRLDLVLCHACYASWIENPTK